MLDVETKRRIDSARDILVGKVPDPKSQVEQITIALVYKFMDDIDQESVDMGGKASFFIGEYEKYAWSRIFDPRMGGYDMLGLYGDAITRMSQNPTIPPLFREIFKNAYLPYRDPETLKLFLKTINEFKYDHSERLGDAFEYLLSVMASQGDAGQFRTPRHLIDFMVKVIKPQKNEIILDPACGTAGFLISAYKYILREHSNGNALTMQERVDLLKNFKGYDISPDMVRLSLVNMYLHGFQQPQIYEYDTLTSEDRWNEYVDVILANPPFMSPKGGIRPHKRFSVQSNRSEVLFVDYMAEHLTPNGRAAIIVPEGIIFQSANAYKQLRKYLVEQNYLWAVVSLPAGIFNPYSGVKTSILLLDRTLAKKTDKILFVKVEADGFDLGAQRKPIEKNDFPIALSILQKWQNLLRENNYFMGTENNSNFVSKSQLANNNEYILSVERYKTDIDKGGKWGTTPLTEVTEYVRGVTYSKDDEVEENGVFVLRANNIDLEHSKLIFNDLRQIRKIQTLKKDQLLRKNDVLICAASGSADHIGKVAFSEHDTQYYIGGFMGVLRSSVALHPKYLFYMLKSDKFRSHIQNNSIGVNIRNLRMSMLSSFNLPLPPIRLQQEIVAEIEGYQRIIDGARQVVDNWKPNIEWELEEERKAAGVDAWEMVKLGEVCEFITGGTPTSTIKEYYENGDIPWLVSGDIHKGEICNCEGRITEKGVDNSNAKTLPKDSVLIALNGQGKTRGTVALLRLENATCNQSLVSINPNDKDELLSEFLYFYLKSKYQQIRNLTGDNQRSGLNMPILKTLEIPVVPLHAQMDTVTRLFEEHKIVEANRRLIQAYEGRIKKVIERV